MKRYENIALLWLLYFVQGLPFGFQATALPVLLREAGASLTAIGLAGAVAAPWLLKPLWAPLVERSASRKRWLLPMQALLAVSAALGGALGAERIAALLAIVAAMNLFAATLDIAVDGLAIDVMAEHDLGYANMAQVVGYKLGMLAGGGLSLWLSVRIGHARAMFAMAGAVLLALLLTSRYREAPRSGRLVGRAAADGPLGYREVLALLRRTFSLPGTGWALVAIASYKLGESLADSMFKPFALDVGFSKDQIGLWIGTWGMLFSVAGSLAGGLLASRWRLWHALALAAVLRVGPLAAQWWLAAAYQAGAAPGADAFIAITCAEHFFGGALTTAMFAWMMSRVDRRIGATHFTALAAIEVIGKALPGLASGAIAERTGYAALFAAAAIISVAFLLLLPRLRRSADA